MFQSRYFIPKASNTLADTLLVFGFTEMLASVIPQSAKPINIEIIDMGSHYVVELDKPLTENMLRTVQEIAPYLVNQKFPLPNDLSGISACNVDQEWEKFHRYQELRSQMHETGRTDEELEQLVADNAPAPDWALITYLSDTKMGSHESYNKLVAQWLRSNEQFGLLNLHTVLQLFASPVNDWDILENRWNQATKGTDLQTQLGAIKALNPHMSQGHNQAKTNSFPLRGKNLSVFWLPEFLKAVGLWQSTIPTEIRKRKDEKSVRKTYVVVPTQINYAYHKKVFRKFRERMRNDRSVSQDILAALLYTEVLLEHAIEDNSIQIFRGGSVHKLVRGMNVVTYYPLREGSYTTMNMAFVGLPDWMPHIRTREDAKFLIEIMQEHLERIRAINEDRSDGYALLQLYRDFVSGNYLEAFFEFCSGYSGYLLSEIKRGAFYVKPFSEKNLRRLFQMATVSQPLSPILQDEGFRNVARAIRLSTVSALYLGKRSRFDVRYGLGTELMRQAQYPDEFAQALAEFMQSYNDESMRVYKRTKGKARRKLITTKDIESVMALVDQHGAKTVCNLLVAFGYARDPKEEETDEKGLAGEHEEQEALAGMA